MRVPWPAAITRAVGERSPRKRNARMRGGPHRAARREPRAEVTASFTGSADDHGVGDREDLVGTAFRRDARACGSPRGCRTWYDGRCSSASVIGITAEPGLPPPHPGWFRPEPGKRRSRNRRSAAEPSPETGVQRRLGVVLDSELDRLRDLVAVDLLDETQRHVDSGGDAGRGDDLALLDHAGRTGLAPSSPAGRGLASGSWRDAVEEPRGGEEQCPGADGGGPDSGLVDGPDPVVQRLVLEEDPIAETAGDDDDVRAMDSSSEASATRERVSDSLRIGPAFSATKIDRCPGPS